jgi:capsular exopolysaccharide synthesis family protein
LAKLIHQTAPNPNSTGYPTHGRGKGKSGNGKGDSFDDNINLGELWRSLKRRKKLVGLTVLVIVVLSAINTGYQRVFHPVYKGGFLLLISNPINSDKSGGGSAGEAVTNPLFGDLARNSTLTDIPTLITLLKSPYLLAPLAERLGISSGGLGARINIGLSGDAEGGPKGRGGRSSDGVLVVQITGRNPKEDKVLLEQISSLYLQAALSERQQRLADGIRFLNQQAPALELKTAELQSEMAVFRQRNNLLDPAVDGSTLKVQLGTLEAQIAGLLAERSRLEGVRQSISAGTLTTLGFEEAIGSGGESSSGGQGLKVAGSSQVLLAQLAKVDQELADARSRFNPKSSVVVGLTARRNALMPLLRSNQKEAVNSALSSNANRLLTARRQYSQVENIFQKQPVLIKQFESLSQKLKIAQENLASLTSTRENFKLEMAQRTVPWKVIAPPQIDPNPVSPSVSRNLAFGLLFGLVAGVGAGLLRDRLDHVFHSPEEVKEELELPVLGHIPYVSLFEGLREDKRFILKELDDSIDASKYQDSKLTGYQRFFYQEALRNLYASMRFLGSDSPLCSVALTSSVPAEGKSLTNILLAKTIAEMGKRVLLIDADLRKPQLHHRLGLNNILGLSNLLADENLDWRDVVRPVEGYPNWTVLTSGLRPPDPTRLLSSNRMLALADEFASSGQFDLVLYDTPPVLGLADATLIAEIVDGLILLVSLNRVDRALPQDAFQRLVSSGVRLLGVVTNAVKVETRGYSAYGYANKGYGYGYGGYDSRSAYAYYADSDEDAALKAQKQVPKTFGDRAASLQRKIFTWIDS